MPPTSPVTAWKMPRSALNIGDQVEAKFTGVDRKNRMLTLSIKAKDFAEEKATIANYSSDASIGTSSLGDLLKEQMGGSDD